MLKAILYVVLVSLLAMAVVSVVRTAVEVKFAPLAQALP